MLIVAGEGGREQCHLTLSTLGLQSTDADDPYAALAEICRRPLVYRAVVLSLASLYREELAIIPALRSRFAHLEIWLTHTDGRQSALAEALGYGCDALLDDAGLHPTGSGTSDIETPAISAQESEAPPEHPPAESPENEIVDEAEAAARADTDQPAEDEQTPEEPSKEGSQEDMDLVSDHPLEPVLTAEELRALLQDSDPDFDEDRA